MRESRGRRWSRSTRCRGQMEQEPLDHEALVRVVLDERLPGLAARIERAGARPGVEREQRAVGVQGGDRVTGERVAVDGLERGDAFDERLGSCVPMDALVVLTESTKLR